MAAKTETNSLVGRCEIHVARIDIGRQDRDSHLAAFVDVLHDLFLVPPLARQNRGHEVLRVTRLEICRAIGEHRISRRMRLVETVAGELLHQIEDAGDLLFVLKTFRAGTIHELFALGGHLFGLLLAHGAAQQIGFTKRIAGDDVGDLHHLFLIDDNAVGFLQDRLQFRQFVLDPLHAVFALDKVVDHSAADRTGTIQRVERRQMLDSWMV